MVTQGLTIDRSQAADVDGVEALLDEAATWQLGRGIDLWRPGQLGEEVRFTIEAGNLYVARRDGVIVGCFMLDEGSPRLTEWLIEHGREPMSGVVGRVTVRAGGSRRRQPDR